MDHLHLQLARWVSHPRHRRAGRNAAAAQFLVTDPGQRGQRPWAMPARRTPADVAGLELREATACARVLDRRAPRSSATASASRRFCSTWRRTQPTWGFRRHRGGPALHHRRGQRRRQGSPRPVSDSCRLQAGVRRQLPRDGGVAPDAGAGALGRARLCVRSGLRARVRRVGDSALALRGVALRLAAARTHLRPQLQRLDRGVRGRAAGRGLRLRHPGQLPAGVPAVRRDRGPRIPPDPFPAAGRATLSRLAVRPASPRRPGGGLLARPRPRRSPRAHVARRSHPPDRRPRAAPRRDRRGRTPAPARPAPPHRHRRQLHRHHHRSAATPGPGCR